MTFYIHNNPDELFSPEVHLSRWNWVWELHNGNEIIAVSARSYSSPNMCEKAINSLKDAFQAQLRRRRPQR